MAESHEVDVFSAFLATEEEKDFNELIRELAQTERELKAAYVQRTEFKEPARESQTSDSGPVISIRKHQANTRLP